jgi:hypothetical protein
MNSLDKYNRGSYLQKECFVFNKHMNLEITDKKKRPSQVGKASIEYRYFFILRLYLFLFLLKASRLR